MRESECERERERERDLHFEELLLEDRSLGVFSSSNLQLIFHAAHLGEFLLLAREELALFAQVCQKTILQVLHSVISI